MTEKDLKNVILVCYDDEAEKYRSSFLEAIYISNHLHLSDEEMEEAKKRYRSNPENIMKRYKIQRSVYWIRLADKTTYEEVELKFKSFFEQGLNIFLCKAVNFSGSPEILHKILN